jgi:hypothetical protein
MNTALSPPPPIVVRQSRKHIALGIVVTLFMLAGSAIAWLSHGGPDEGVMDWIARIGSKYLGPPRTLFIFVYLLKRLFNTKPLFTVDENGIATRGFGLIRWDEIAQVRTIEVRGRRFLGIVPCNIEALAERYQPREARRMRWNYERMGMATGFAEIEMSGSFDSVLQAIHALAGSRITGAAPIDAFLANTSRYIRRPSDKDISTYSLKEKRVAIKCYCRKQRETQAFVTRAGRRYEGYILEVQREAIEFEWGFSIQYGGGTETERLIPIDDIVLLID